MITAKNTMTPAVKDAIEEIKTSFAKHIVTVEPEKQGGAHVIVHDVNIGQIYIPPVTWVGFLIDFQYPRSDVYPHFIDGSTKRSNNSALGEGFSDPRNWQGRNAIQVSRRSNHRDSAVDTAALKLMKVIEWLRTR